MDKIKRHYRKGEQGGRQCLFCENYGIENDTDVCFEHDESPIDIDYVCDDFECDSDRQLIRGSNEKV